MSINILKKNWGKSFEESIESVENYLKKSDDDYPDLANFRILANWLIENPYNSYDYLPQEDLGFRSTPFGTEHLFAKLHHALCDDGDVSFVKMIHDGEIKRVFMIFVWQHEDCFLSICQKENQYLINSFCNANESLNRMLVSLKNIHPENEKDIQLKDSVSLTDFQFIAHRDPVQFIKDVEDFELQQQKTREDNATWEKKTKTRKP